MKIVRLSGNFKIGVINLDRLNVENMHTIFDNSKVDLFKQGKIFEVSYELGGKIQLKIDDKIYNYDAKKFVDQ